VKIGFSFGKCIRDIVQGKVDIDDVLLIVARTRMHNVDSVRQVISNYMSRSDYLAGLDEEKCQEIGVELYVSGKVHQARLEGSNISKHGHRILDVWRGSVSEEGVWADVVPAAHMNEQVKEVWNHYRFLLNMTASIPEKESYQ